MKITTFVLTLCFFIITGCTVRHGDFSVLSNKLIDTTKFELDQADRAKGVTGVSRQQIIVLFPVGEMPTLEGAIDDALEKGGGDVMTDATVKMSWWFIPYIYGRFSWVVTGDVVKTRKK